MVRDFWVYKKRDVIKSLDDEEVEISEENGNYAKTQKIVREFFSLSSASSK